MAHPDQRPLPQLARWLATASRGVAFTGAGISTESGIPDFRSPNGVWATSRPVAFDEFLSSPAARHEYWRQKSVAEQDFERSAPNAGHRWLAEWESRGWLRGVITQNIDGLHAAAGSRQVLELHGTAREVACLDCQARFPSAPWVRQFLECDEVPQCPACSGLLKHATISFGQHLDAQVLESAGAWATEADLFLALGSSLVVEPAASLPRLAQRLGARLAIINRDPTPLDRLADLVIHGEIGEVLEQVEREIEREIEGGIERQPSE